jgi:hypothetical protein
MSDSEKLAGGWVILTKLRSDLRKDALVPMPALLAAVTTWMCMRGMRNEPPLNHEATARKAEVDPDVNIRIFGNSVLSLEVTKNALDEFASVLLHVLEQNEVEFYLAGQRYACLREGTIRPTDVQVH